MPDLHLKITALFDSSDDIKNAAAFCLGHLALGNISFYLKFISSQIKEHKNQQSFVFALHEFIINFHGDTKIFSAVVWELLFSVETRPIVSDSIGQLCLMDPIRFMPVLVKNCQDANVEVRISSICAFRFLVSHNIQDGFISGDALSFFMGLNDSEIKVRNAALSALNATIHFKSRILNPLLGEIVPLLYKQTIFQVTIFN